MRQFSAWIGVAACALIACAPVADGIVWLKNPHAPFLTNGHLLYFLTNGHLHYDLGLYPSWDWWGWQWAGVTKKIVQAILLWPAWSGLLFTAFALFALALLIEKAAESQAETKQDRLKRLGPRSRERD